MKKGVVSLLILLIALSFSLPAQVDTIAISQAQVDTVAIPQIKVDTATITQTKVDTATITQAKVDTVAITQIKVDTAAITHSDKQTDSIKQPKKHSPTTAILLSIIPGGGQIYNKKWWKVPIIYAGLGASSYCIYHYGKLTRQYQLEYRYRVSEDTTLRALCDPKLAPSSNEVILSTKNYYQRSLEIAIAATIIIYVLNFVDALVDAHLFQFDVSDNLSLRIAPTLLPDVRTGRYAPAATICLKF